MSAATPATTAPALALLTHAHAPAAAAAIHATKLHRKPLFLHATDARSTRQAARAAAAAATTTTRRKPAPLTAREKRALRIHQLPRAAPYATFAPLHALWAAYMREVLGAGCAGQGQAQLGARLASADYHGAVLEVVRSRCPSRVGVRGVCVKETRGMFYLVTEQGRVKEMPKEYTVFRFELPLLPPEGAGVEGMPTASASASAEPGKPRCMVFELHGQQFMYRSAERVGKKFKNKALTDL